MPRFQENGNKVFLSPDEALVLIQEGDHQHTFRLCGGMLLGFDETRKMIEQHL
jgi:hypothetical protein